MNDFLKQCASDIKTTGKPFTEDDFYYMSGRYTGAYQIYGRQGQKFLYLYEDKIYPADFVP